MSEFEEKAHRWVRGVIRSEMVKREITFAQLAEKLAIVGHHDEEHNLRNKVARGTFSAAFFVQCLAAMGCKTLAIDLLDSLYPDFADPGGLRDARLAAEAAATAGQKARKKPVK